MKDLFLNSAQSGTVEWIGLRPARREPIHVVEHAEIDVETGLIGDRYRGQPGSDRMVTLIQSEHLDAIASFLGRPTIDPSVLRRNIVVSGINLLSFKAPDREMTFRVGEAILRMTGNCHPCSRMEENLGPGGFSAMRGMGGITATVVQGGSVALGDEVALVINSDTNP